MSFRWVQRGASLAVLAGCGGDPRLESPLLDVPLLAAIDLDPDPTTVEIELRATVGRAEIAPGVATEVWGYRDGAVPGSGPTVPGPLIRARAGDRVVIHFHNDLSEGTTLHPHGPRVPYEMDGVPMDGGIVMPGASRDHVFVASDAGTFWYHPHWEADDQMERGLYGPLVVADGAMPADRERVFLLDEIDLDPAGRIVVEPTAEELLVGRHGALMLVNGRPDARIGVESGGRERWRFVNASNGRYFELALPGHRFWVIGGDGGLLVAPYLAETIRLAPAERADVVVDLDGPVGEVLVLETLAVGRGVGRPVDGRRPVMEIAFQREAARPRPPIDAVLPSRPFEPLAAEGARERLIELTWDPDPLRGSEPAFFVNGERWPFTTPLEGAVGALEKWELRNRTPGPEPVHLHGTLFQVLDAGVPSARIGLKDTVDVPAEASVWVVFRYERPGSWMFHSHLLEHAERGMMSHVHVP
jgi:FtsP/CotA-like multicopper oxidase with cupredoxin domain